jgi:hypothetical protein
MKALRWRFRQTPTEPRTTLEFDTFERRAPTSQTALDIFSGQWASDCSFVVPGVVSGAMPNFRDDPRPQQCSDLFQGLSGKRLLELGPMEGANTWQLEQLGASEIIAVESNKAAFLKCLIVKEIADLRRSRFMLGDCCEFLSFRDQAFDLIFCSGVLYHLSDPLRLIKLMSAATDQVFVWTHYVRPGVASDLDRGPSKLEKTTTHRDGMDVNYYIGRYADRSYGLFLGGNASFCAWMERDQMLDAFVRYGFRNIQIVSDHADHHNGPAITFGASK